MTSKKSNVSYSTEKIPPSMVRISHTNAKINYNVLNYLNSQTEEDVNNKEDLPLKSPKKKLSEIELISRTYFPRLHDYDTIQSIRRINGDKKDAPILSGEIRGLTIVVNPGEDSIFNFSEDEGDGFPDRETYPNSIQSLQPSFDALPLVESPPKIPPTKKKRRKPRRTGSISPPLVVETPIDNSPEDISKEINSLSPNTSSDIIPLDEGKRNSPPVDDSSPLKEIKNPRRRTRGRKKKSGVLQHNSGTSAESIGPAIVGSPPYISHSPPHGIMESSAEKKVGVLQDNLWETTLDTPSISRGWGIRDVTPSQGNINSLRLEDPPYAKSRIERPLSAFRPIRCSTPIRTPLSP